WRAARASSCAGDRPRALPSQRAAHFLVARNFRVRVHSWRGIVAETLRFFSFGPEHRDSRWSGHKLSLRAVARVPLPFLESKVARDRRRRHGDSHMKALLALIVVYVGAFFFVLQGSSQNQVQAARQSGNSTQSNSIDPVKEADIRSLMELVGARDMVQDGTNNAIEQSREKLIATVPSNDKGQAFVNAFATSYQKKLDVDQITEQLVGIYDKHFTDDEIKGLLQFYGL